MLFGTFLVCTAFGVLSVCSGLLHSGKLELNKNLRLAWRINSTKGTIRFTVEASIDQKNGWFLIGLAPQKNSTKGVSLNDISGNACVVWKGPDSNSNKHKSGWRFTEVDVVKGTLKTIKKNSNRPHYHFKSPSYETKKHILTAIIWRPMKTDNKKVTEIKHGKSVVVFGSYGNDEDGDKIRKWKNLMKQLNKGSLQDAFTATEHVDFFNNSSNSHKDSDSKDKDALAHAAAIAEKHWIGVVIGISAFLTVIITCSVYCFTKKKKAEFKRVVSMPFHKNSDYDDEAKVAFLQSEET